MFLKEKTHGIMNTNISHANTNQTLLELGNSRLKASNKIKKIRKKKSEESEEGFRFISEGSNTSTYVNAEVERGLY